MVLKEVAEARAREPQHRSHREVDLPGRDDQHLGQCHDRNQTEVDAREEDRVLREEVRRGEPTVEEVKNEEQDERALPPHQ